jgi:cytosine/creatinine deaminase
MAGAPMDLIVRRARLMDGRIADVAIAGDTIAAIEPQLDARAAMELDAGENLALPAFVNGQLHACKSFWRRLLAQLPPEIQHLPRFQAARHVKRLYTAENVFQRVDEVMRLAIQNGTCAIRLFADVDADSGLAALEGLLRIREQYRPLLHVEVVAFPQDGLAGDAGRLMQEAMERGADVVGGIPWIEPHQEAQRRHVDDCFALARAFDRDLHFVCDDTADPAARTLEMVAHQTIACGYQGRVSATQCAALAFYPDEHARQVIRLVKEAGITVFCNSHVSLIATEFEPRQPWPRGITRVRELLDAGVPVACAQDDVDNWFYAFGRNDLLEVAQFMAHNGQFAWNGAVERVLPMVTHVPARVLGLENYGLHTGAEANLVVLDAADWHQAIQFQADRRFVILRGRLAAWTERHSEVHV